ncbi:hypothetical protein AAFF_G00033550 [Aldrovandia affinis]|uniref:Uncharacterized protein n=1 Tax=Aldrovandia affinis TaxID=143900 RepID=A0AAD7WG47_9TELE|nr:hypothetical protein AAFF_G00033550 [Aldrovandia affinis]
MKEEVEQRDTHILNLREQLLCVTAAEQPPHSQTTDTGSQTETSSQAEPHISLDSSVDPSPPPSTGQHCSSSRTHRPSPALRTACCRGTETTAMPKAPENCHPHGL